MVEVQGTFDSGFEGVRDALAANLDSGADVGASVAVIVDGDTAQSSGPLSRSRG